MRLLLALIVMATATLAAPIPKSLKAKRPFDITGMWKLVEHNSNGKQSSVEGMVRYWAFTEESFEFYTNETTKMGNNPTQLTTSDPEQPHLKNMGGHPCCFERDGNRMRWVYSSDTSLKLNDCEPGPKRNVYTFELVK